MTYQDKREWMWRYRRLKMRVYKIESEYMDLLEMATNTTPNLSGMPSGGSVSDRVGNAAALLEDKSEEAKQIRQLCDRVREEIKAAINTIDSDLYKAMLTIKFIEGASDIKIAERLGLDERHVRRCIAFSIQKLDLHP